MSFLPTRRNRRGGFTLLEVLVAMAVMSIGLVAVFELFSADLRGLAASEDYVSAVIKAEAKMREVLDDGDLSEKELRDSSPEGFELVSSVKKTSPARTEDLPVELFEVDVTVKWTRGSKERSLTLRSMKLLPKKI